MQTLQELWQLFVALWNTGNRWARWAIAILTLWPFVLVTVALGGVSILTSLLALLPVAGLLLLVLAYLGSVGHSRIRRVPEGAKGSPLDRDHHRRGTGGRCVSLDSSG